MSILMLACTVVQSVFVHLAMDDRPRDSKERNGAGVITAGKVERQHSPPLKDRKVKFLIATDYSGRY